MSSKSRNIFSINKDKFLYLAILVFVFISTTALSLNKQPDLLINIPIKAQEEKPKDFSPIPILNTDSYPTISAQGAIAMDLDSGINLYEKNPDQTLLPASTTKIVTALVALESFKLDQILTVPKGSFTGQKMGLFEGEQMRFEDLLYGLLVYSANDAAETLAANYCSPIRNEDYSLNCGKDAFIEAMNAKAIEFYMESSNFQNPVGFDGVNHITTARDLIRISEVAMQNPVFARIVGTREIVVSDITGENKYRLRNINQLLGEVEGIRGVKTGWTENARENLVTYIERDGHRVMIAILGSQDRFGETKELIDWIFSNYTWKKVVPG